MNGSAPPPLRVENVSAYYGAREAVADVSMPFAANAVTALMGPSGCGKTTLLRCLNRILDLHLATFILTISEQDHGFSSHLLR